MSDEIKTLEEWRKTDRLVAWAKKTLSDNRFELMLQIMERREHVRHYDQPCEGIQKLGRIEGWDLFLKRMMMFTEPSETISMPEPTFAPEEPEK